jgi:hypothetical protein
VTTQVWQGRFLIDSTTQDFTIDRGGGADPVQLTTGAYYIAGYTGETQLCEHMQVQIRDIHADYEDTTVVYSYTTGKVTIDFGVGNNFSLTWTDTALRDLLGFTANIVTTRSTTGTNRCQYTWIPDRSLSHHPVQLNQFWVGKTTSLGQISRDGTPCTNEGQLLNVASVAYRMVHKDYSILPSTGTVYQEFQQFYEDVIHKGQPMRVYPDNTATTASDYVTGIVLGEDSNEIPQLADLMTRHIPSFDNLWDYDIPLREHT